MAFLLLLNSAHPCSAAELAEGLYIDIPNDFAEAEMKDKKVLFHGFNNTLGIELGIYTQRDLQTNRVHSWADKTDAELSSIAAEAIAAQNEDTAAISGWSIFKNEQMNFIVFDGTITADTGEVLTYLQYCTIINGGTLQLTFYKNEAFTDDERQMTEGITQSAHYDKLSEPGIDTSIILKLGGIVLVIIGLILSVVWNIRRYRKKVRKEVESQHRITNVQKI